MKGYWLIEAYPACGLARLLVANEQIARTLADGLKEIGIEAVAREATPVEAASIALSTMGRRIAPGVLAS